MSIMNILIKKISFGVLLNFAVPFLLVSAYIVVDAYLHRGYFGRSGTVMLGEAIWLTLQCGSMIGFLIWAIILRRTIARLTLKMIAAIAIIAGLLVDGILWLGGVLKFGYLLNVLYKEVLRCIGFTVTSISDSLSILYLIIFLFLSGFLVSLLASPLVLFSSAGLRRIRTY